MTIEQRVDQLEKRNKRLKVALTMMAVVTMAATGEKDGNFDVVRAKNIFVESGVMARSIAVISDENTLAVTSGITDNGNSWVKTISAKGKALVELTSTVDDKGVVMTYQPNGKKLLELSSNGNGGATEVSNKTAEGIIQMYADEYGNGVVYAGNRKGKGRTLEPGP